MLSLSACVQAIWPLSRNFEYAAEVALELRRTHPAWWRQFELVFDARGRYPLPQAQGFAFMAWLEEHFADADSRLELLTAVERAFRDGPGRLRTELRASVDCLDRDYKPREDPDDPPELFGERVVLYQPAACAGYPDGLTAYLDNWTGRALHGALVEPVVSPPASITDLTVVHDRRYVDGLFAFAAAGGGLLTPETEVAVDAPAAVLAGAGAMIDATRRALAGDPGPHLVGARPGSHHAEHARGGGTCLVNNIAVAAGWALRRGVRSVGVVDLDAHHGNGTEQIFREDPRVFTMSVHQAGVFFPGTGSREETGRGAGAGTNLNLPVTPESDWVAAVKAGLGQVARRRPRLLLVQFSADAHRSDPVSDLRVSDGEFAEAVRALLELRVPVVFELGASLSERAWVGALRALAQAASERALADSA